ncbi:hypothetical protein WJX82_002979 [Trebouxia sp. C0006]
MPIVVNVWHCAVPPVFAPYPEQSQNSRPQVMAMRKVNPAGNKEELKKAVHAYADPQGDATLFLQDDEGLQNQHSLSIPPVLLQGSKIKILNWSSSRHINKALIMGTNPARLANGWQPLSHKTYSKQLQDFLADPEFQYQHGPMDRLDSISEVDNAED